MVAASWVDANVVNIVSNADESRYVTIERRIKQNKVAFKAPKCVREYNSGMQGVDRLDQLRSRFSLSDGHSFKKWHLKLAMAFVDIARCNAFITRRLALDEEGEIGRDLHRQFVIELSSQLISGDWKMAINDEGLMYSSLDEIPILEESTGDQQQVETMLIDKNESESINCKPERSKNVMAGCSRSKRNCKVCLLEGRKEKRDTVYCREHNVCLCAQSWPTDHDDNERRNWTCWEKFHSYYLPTNTFSSKGHIRRSSDAYKALQDRKRRSEQELIPDRTLRLSSQDSLISSQEYVFNLNPSQ